jgi:predicted methyltransferase
MIMRASLFVAAALVAAPLLGATAGAADAIPAPIAAAVADTTRPAADTGRDAVRKPAEMLALAGVKPGEQVAELWPGGGYFTRVLSLTVGARGHVYALTPPPRPRPPASSAPTMASAPAMSSAPPMSPLQVLANDPHYGNISLLPFAALTSDPPTAPSVDLVWTSDNYHDFHNLPNADMAALNRHVFGLLKSGGVYIVIDHAAAPGHGADDTRTLHRIDPEIVKSEVESAGFRLAASSDALHVADDPHTSPIFDGSIRGHTDQFALKFVKP